MKRSHPVVSGMVALLVFLLATGAVAQTMGNIVARSLFSDKKGFVEGDIITVLIVEFTEGTNETNTQTNSDNRLQADANTSGKLTDILPSLGINSTMQNRHNAQGATKSRGTLSGKMTVVVTEVADNGLLSVEGTRVVNINGERQTTILTGVVRPEDVSAGNTVYSYNIANAQISYKGKGLATQAGKPGILARIWNWIF